MGIRTTIEWCDSTVNPTENCDGCELWAGTVKICYAGRATERWKGRGAFDQPIRLFPGRTKAAAAWSDLRGQARPDKAWIPPELPRLIFVSDMSDALSSAVSFEFLAQEIIDAAAFPPGNRHIWIWLTKRPKRMAEFSAWMKANGVRWPTNLWAMTSVTGQKSAECRIPWILRVGEASTVRGVSAEPLLGPVKLAAADPLQSLDWIIIGGESGRLADSRTERWIIQLWAMSKGSRLPCFVKQMGHNPNWKDKKGGDWNEWPERLRLREFPLKKAGL